MMLCLIIGVQPLPAVELPSLFRGVVVSDSQIGVRVVSVDEASQARRADLRPEDIIVQIHGEEIHTIDEFAAVSLALKSRTPSTTILIFRNGKPLELTLHLYSYPVFEAWGVEFIPNDDVRFAQPEAGRDYWNRLGRAYADVGRPADALDAYLNALHNVPDDVPAATQVARLYWELGQQHVQAHRTREGLQAFEQALAMMQRLIDRPLTEEQLQVLRTQLQQTIQALRDSSLQS